MDAERVQIEVADHVADVRMVRGDKHNGLDWRMFGSPQRGDRRAAATPQAVRAVVLSGEGPSFCAGLDCQELRGAEAARRRPRRRRPRQRSTARSPTSPSGSPTAGASSTVPVIAALHGACIGGGLQIALGADVRIAAPDAQLSVMEIRYGLVPDMSLSADARPAGARRRRPRARLHGAGSSRREEALELGLVTRIEDDPLAAAHGLCAPRSPPARRTRSGGSKRLANEVAEAVRGRGAGAARPSSRRSCSEARTRRGRRRRRSTKQTARVRRSGRPGASRSSALAAAVLTPRREPGQPADDRSDGHGRAPARTAATHEVANQAPPLEDYNVFEADRSLVEALRARGRRLGRGAGPRGSARSRVGAARSGWGFEANENPPKLRTHDRFGNRIDEVEFHPAWHELMALAVAHGLHALPWREPQPGAHVARAAMFMALAQAEAGVGCPISMTYSAIPALRTQPELAAEWEPRFISLDYDGELRPGRREARRALRHGDDREAGRLRRARQHDRRRAAERRRARRRVRAHRPQVVLLGADVRRLPRPRPGRRRALLLPHAALHPRRRAQRASTSSASRTSSATAPTPRARSSSAAPGRSWSARRAAACRRSSRWSTTPGSTARSAPPPAMRAGRRPARSTTPRSARPSASC